MLGVGSRVLVSPLTLLVKEVLFVCWWVASLFLVVLGLLLLLLLLFCCVLFVFVFVGRVLSHLPPGGHDSYTAIAIDEVRKTRLAEERRRQA